MEKITCNICGKEKNGVQTGVCNHCGKFGKTNRELASEWFESLPYQQKEKYRYQLSRYSSLDSPIDPVLYPDQNLLEEIWEKETNSSETPQFCEDKKVDFEMLQEYLKSKEEHDPLFLNLQLFFKMLSKSSSFAHKAHKELQKLS